MALISKLKRVLAEAFPPPAKISLKDDDGIVGVITSARFRNMDSMARQDLLQELLETHGIGPKDMRRVLILVAVTPEEETAHSAID